MRILILMVALVIVGCNTADEVAEVLEDSPAAPPMAMNCPNFLWKNTFRMVLIPSGHFTMGNDVVILDHLAHEFQAYTGYYYIDMFEVTVSEFQFFVETSGYQRESPAPEFPEFPSEREIAIPSHPAQVTWRDANAYARWVGKRLPTEIEWEKAARGGVESMPFTWGDTQPTGGSQYERYVRAAGGKSKLWMRTQMAAEGAFAIGHGSLHFNGEWLSGIVGPSLDYAFSIQPVGTYDRNGYGLFDMLGNVDEWCQDDWNTNAYMIFMLDPETKSIENPDGEPRFINGVWSESKVVRGGGLKHSVFIASQRHVVNNKGGAEINSKQHQFLNETIDVGERGYAHVEASSLIGFRCVMDR